MSGTTIQYQENNTAGSHEEQTIFGVCRAHKSSKRGVCEHCRSCKKCIAPSICTKPENHQRNVRGRRKSSRPPLISEDVQFASNPMQFNDHMHGTGLRYINDNLSREGSAQSSHESMIMSVDNVASNAMYDGLQGVFVALGLNRDVLRRIPNDGVKNVLTNTRELRRVKRVIRDIIERTCDLLIQDSMERECMLTTTLQARSVYF